MGTATTGSCRRSGPSQGIQPWASSAFRVIVRGNHAHFFIGEKVNPHVSQLIVALHRHSPNEAFAHSRSGKRSIVGYKLANQEFSFQAPPQLDRVKRCRCASPLLPPLLRGDENNVISFGAYKILDICGCVHLMHRAFSPPVPDATEARKAQPQLQSICRPDMRNL